MRPPFAPSASALLASVRFLLTESAHAHTMVSHHQPQSDAPRPTMTIAKLTANRDTLESSSANTADASSPANSIHSASSRSAKKSTTVSLVLASHATSPPQMERVDVIAFTVPSLPLLLLKRSNQAQK